MESDGNGTNFNLESFFVSKKFILALQFWFKRVNDESIIEFCTNKVLAKCLM